MILSANGMHSSTDPLSVRETWFPDVYKRQVADNAVVDVHVAAVVEHVEGAGDVDFQRRCDVLRLFLILRPQQEMCIRDSVHDARHAAFLHAGDV